MAKYLLHLLVIFAIVHASLQDTQDNEVDGEDALSEAAAAILKEQNAQNIASVVTNFMQSGGAAKIGDALTKLGSQHAGQILQGLGSLITSSKKKDKEEDSDDDNSDSILEGLGSLMGSLQGAADAGGGDGAAGAILQGLGSLLGGQGGRGNQGGINPAMIGSLINMFANSKPSKKSSKPSKASKPPKKAKADNPQAKSEPDLDLGDILSLASSFLGKGKDDNPAGNLLGYLPMIMQTINAFNSPEAKKREERHAEHSGMLPPLLEKFHVIFDNFIHSEMGKYVINAMGAEKAFKVFTDESGRFNYPKFVEKMENRSFRRHWIRMVTDRLAEMLQYANDPKMQKE